MGGLGGRCLEEIAGESKLGGDEKRQKSAETEEPESESPNPQSTCLLAE